ncbi:uncharacterized protein LOC134529306 [Bacillus rossius redtenbacheri]|uniref:uncharacterized protein LOC134529306 n=1 Tax=Bacillus rossius redtenbacheri TaxID=93214 RepID=UPI002FDC8631
MAQMKEEYLPRTIKHLCCVYLEQLNECSRQLQRESRRLEALERLSQREEAALGEVKAALEYRVISLACLVPIKVRALLEQYEQCRLEYDRVMAAPLHIPNIVSCTTSGTLLATLVEKMRSQNLIIKSHFNSMLCHSFCIGPAGHVYHQCSMMLERLSRADESLRSYAHTHRALSLLRALDTALSTASDTLYPLEPAPEADERLGESGPFMPLVRLLSGQLLGEEEVTCTEPSVREERVAPVLPPPPAVGLPPVVRCLLGAAPRIIRVLCPAQPSLQPRWQTRSHCVGKLPSYSC